MTFEHIGDRFYAAWHDPAAVAEREAKRAEIHQFFDDIRDRARAAAEQEEAA